MSRHHDPCHGPTLTRREALAGAGVVAAAGAVGVTLLADPAPVWANPTRPVADDLDVYVLVTDGMRPDAKPTTSRRPYQAMQRTDSSKASPPTAS